MAGRFSSWVVYPLLGGGGLCDATFRRTGPRSDSHSIKYTHRLILPSLANQPWYNPRHFKRRETVPHVTAPHASDDPLAGIKELSVDVLVDQVLARNPSLAQMVAAWQAASARYPQVTSLEDPMVTGKLGPGSFGSNNVDFAYMVEVSQKLPFPGKRGLRGQTPWLRPVPPSWTLRICACN